MKIGKSGHNIENGKKDDLAKMTKQLEDYSITLDIKNNVIEELQDKLDNSYSLSGDVLSNVPILQKIEVQFFWERNNSGFSEEASLKKELVFSNGPVDANFPLPEKPENLTFFRLDIGKNIGFVNLHTIEIKNERGKSFWKWDKKNVIHKNGMFFIENNITWPNTLVHLSLCGDPYFILPNGIQDVTSKEKLFLSLNLSALTQAQNDAIYNQIGSPLSYYTHEAAEFSHALHIFYNGNQALANEVTSARNDINRLNEEKTAAISHAESIKAILNAATSERDNLQLTLNSLIEKETEREKLFLETIRNNETSMGQLANNHSVLEQNNKTLATEIEVKNSVIYKLTKEREKVVSESEQKLHELANTFDILEKERNELQKNLTDVRNSEKSLSIKIKELEQIINTAKEQYAKNTELLNNHNKQLTVDNSTLTTALTSREQALYKGLEKIDVLEANSKELNTHNRTLEDSLNMLREKQAAMYEEQLMLKETQKVMDCVHQTMVEQTNELSKLLKKQQDHIKEIGSEKNIVLVENDQLKNILFLYKERETGLVAENKQKDAENILLNKDITDLKADIRRYTEIYDKKSSLQIMINRILKKY